MAIISGSTGDDLIEGTENDDRLSGKLGADTLIGYRGDDVLGGGRGDDLLRGGRGDDELLGKKGDDRLRGGKGDDLLEGGKGDDDLRGGNGDDVFLFNVEQEATGEDEILDFEVGDTIRIQGMTDYTVFEAPPGFIQISFDDENHVIVYDAALTDVTQAIETIY